MTDAHTVLDARRGATKIATWLASLVLLVVFGACPVFGTSEIERTRSGLPDLTGTYDLATLTPLQRSATYGDRLAHTADEVRAILEQTAARTQAANSPSDPDREAPPVGGNVGGYNYFFLDPGTSPTRVDGEYRTSLIIDPPNGRLPPLTDRGKVRRDGLYSFWGKNSGEAWWLGAEVGPYDDPESLSIGDRCIHHLEATIPTIPRLYNNLKTIVQTETHVVIVTEWMHTARVVRLGERGEVEHAPPQIRSRSGDSVGWWEGDTLVVETPTSWRKTGSPCRSAEVRLRPLIRGSSRGSHRALVATWSIASRFTRATSRGLTRRSTPGRGPTTASTSTPATRATTRWAAFCAVPGCWSSRRMARGGASGTAAHADSQRLPKNRAAPRNTAVRAPSTSSCGHSPMSACSVDSEGSSYQKTLR